ncbi:hypothetical protein ACFLUA_04200 [Chloroflexota bacterium]
MYSRIAATLVVATYVVTTIMITTPDIKPTQSLVDCMAFESE